jgi:hypothetical protein
MTQQDAYESAGYASSAANASTAAKKPHIRARVLEISQDKELAGKSTPMPPLETDPSTGLLTGEAKGLTEEWLVQQLRINIQQAQVAGKFREANTAIQMLGNYFGGIFDPKNPIDQTKKNDQNKPGTGNGDNPRSILDMASAMSEAMSKPEIKPDDPQDDD